MARRWNAAARGRVPRWPRARRPFRRLSCRAGALQLAVSSVRICRGIFADRAMVRPVAPLRRAPVRVVPRWLPGLDEPRCVASATKASERATPGRGDGVARRNTGCHHRRRSGVSRRLRWFCA
jgi:hypothetical protein